LGFVTRVVPDGKTSGDSNGDCQRLAQKPEGALRASKRLMIDSKREQIEQAIKAENKEFSTLVRSADAKEALTAFLEKRPPDFTRTKERPAAAKASNSTNWREESPGCSVAPYPIQGMSHDPAPIRPSVSTD